MENHQLPITRIISQSNSCIREFPSSTPTSSLSLHPVPVCDCIGLHQPVEAHNAIRKQYHCTACRNLAHGGLSHRYEPSHTCSTRSCMSIVVPTAKNRCFHQAIQGGSTLTAPSSEGIAISVGSFQLSIAKTGAPQRTEQLSRTAIKPVMERRICSGFSE